MILEEAYAEYVNLDKRTDRKDLMEKSLKAAGITATRRRGLLPSEVQIAPARIKAMWDRPQKGAIGCHFSQVAVMKAALQRGKHALVMEDDLVFCRDFQLRMEYVSAFLEAHEWDILWLGGTFHVNPPWWHNSTDRGCQNLGRDCQVVPGYHRMIRTFGCFCTYAYLVNVESIGKILAMFEEKLPQSIGIDHMMIMLQPSLWTYAYVPGMVKQYDHTSDIGTDGKGGPGFTKFSNFATLNGTKENSAYWFQEYATDFNPETFNWHEAGR